MAGIVPREQVIRSVDELLDAASFCRDVYLLAARCAKSPLVAAVLVRAGEERQALVDDLRDALVAMDAQPADRDAPALSLLGSDDLELATWCGCADDILDTALAAAKGLPDYLAPLLRGRRQALDHGRKRVRAWESMLSSSLPTAIPELSRGPLERGSGSQTPGEQAPRATLLVHVCARTDARGQAIAASLASRGIDAKTANGIGVGLGRLCLDDTALLAVDRELARELDAALEEVDLVAVRRRVHLIGASAADVAAAEIARRVAAEARAGRVLVVEDDPDLRALLTSTLANRGFAVAEARDGVDALSKLSPAFKDVIVLDLMMPRLSGIAFLRELEDRVLEPPPVVIYSAYVEPITTSYPNVTAVLRKTAAIEDVMRAVAQSLELRA